MQYSEDSVRYKLKCRLFCFDLGGIVNNYLFYKLIYLNHRTVDAL